MFKINFSKKLKFKYQLHITTSSIVPYKSCTNSPQRYGASSRTDEVVEYIAGREIIQILLDVNLINRRQIYFTTINRIGQHYDVTTTIIYSGKQCSLIISKIRRITELQWSVYIYIYIHTQYTHVLMSYDYITQPSV